VPVLTAPPLPAEPAQTPLGIKKHPLDNWIPFPNVDVAELDVTLRRLVLIPPTKVEVAVDVARYAAAVGVEEETMLPLPSEVSSMLVPKPERVREVRVGEEENDGAPLLAVSTVLAPPWAVTESAPPPFP